MRPVCAQRGFTLVTAIFLLVVVAGLVVYMSNIRVAQQTTLLYGVQGARAMQAAHSGIEWGIYRSLADIACPAATSFTIPDPALSRFNVSIDCNESTHIEGMTTIKTYRLTAIATSGSFGSIDYVQRRIQATVSIDPP